MIAYAILTAIAGGAIALAYGYRGQRDQEREQVVYLRAQLAGTPQNVRALPDQSRSAHRGGQP